MLPAHESGVGLLDAIDAHPTFELPDVVPIWARWDAASGDFRVDWRLLEDVREREIEPVLYCETGALTPSLIESGAVDRAVKLMGARSRGALVRPFHEGNGSLFPWGRWPAPQYVACYQRFARLLHDEGALTAYCMSHRNKRNDDLLDRWPGEEYVDVVGFTEFRRSDSERPPVQQWAYAAERLASTGKPVWVFETGAEASTTKRGAWIDSLADVESIGIEAVCIFDFRIEYSGIDGSDKVDDWRWSPSMARAFDGLPR
jgi:hypothetical protein